MTSQPGTGGTGALYEHTAEGVQAAREDVVIPRPDGDVVASFNDPPGPKDTPADREASETGADASEDAESEGPSHRTGERQAQINQHDDPPA